MVAVILKNCLLSSGTKFLSDFWKKWEIASTFLFKESYAYAFTDIILAMCPFDFPCCGTSAALCSKCLHFSCFRVVSDRII